MSKNARVIIVIFLGMFGIHKFIDSKSLMTRESLKLIAQGHLPRLEVSNLNLSNDEICHFADIGYTFKDKTITTGYVGKSSGYSIKPSQGLSYRTGETRKEAIRETQRTTYKGELYITNKRVIYSSTNECFDKTFDKITSIIETKDGILLQIGSASYSIIIKTHSEFVKVFNMLKNNIYEH